LTAEVAILNKSAVALAADSTVTIGAGGSGPAHKTYNTVNKLFALTKHHPVGVMIFGNAELMGVPWETIIKEYRHQLGKACFDTIDAYASALLDYLQNSRVFFPDAQQRFYFKVNIYGILHRAKELIDKAAAAAEEASKDPKEAANKRAVRICERIYKQSLLKCIDEPFKNRIIEEYKDDLSEAATAALDKCPIDSEVMVRLREAAVYQLCSDRKADSRSGVVLAGFGDKQFFPAVHAVSPQLVVLDRLIYAEEPSQCHRIDFDDDAALIPFAQGDVVHTFLRGINPRYVDLLDETLQTVFDGLPKVVEDKLSGVSGIDAATIAAVKAAIEANTDAAKTEFFDQLQQVVDRQNIQPLLDVIGMLPKDELAAMAEALVNLTSVKRKMSYGPETVGGPVDVAVISKGDGFIWISRKHYFKPELNLQFSQSYLER
jgi:hypothetical protein